MSEYIEREDLEIVLNSWRNFLIEAYGKDDHYTSGFDEAVKIVGNFTSADVATVVHGKWIPVEAYGIGNTAKCSECEKRQYGYDGFKFCPNCGCRMDGGAD